MCAHTHASVTAQPAQHNVERWGKLYAYSREQGVCCTFVASDAFAPCCVCANVLVIRYTLSWGYDRATDTMQITNLHVRYEDPITQPEAPFACGLTLHNVGAFTVDEAGKEIFVKKEAMALLRKAAELSRFAVYFDTGARRASCGTSCRMVCSELCTVSLRPHDACPAQPGIVLAPTQLAVRWAVAYHQRLDALPAVASCPEQR